jgi:chemotaxis methyl-accepting protein methylase
MMSTAPLDEAGLALLMAKIERRGLSVSSYKEPCLRRRLAVRMRARGVHTFGDYAKLLDQVPAEFDLLLDALTINVTRFFRNPETYALIRERIVPPLSALAGPVAVWSAGSATGEEPYSLAILFAAQAGRARVRIDATDLDPGALAFLAKAEYPASAVTEVPKDLMARWFSAGPPYRVAETARKLVHPIRHDLTREAPPAPPYQLIMCRNVVIYFDRATQEKLFERFYDALAPGGWLVLGKVETLFGKARTLFKTEDARERLFRKPA